MFDIEALGASQVGPDGEVEIHLIPSVFYPATIQHIQEALSDYRAIEAERGEAPFCSEVAPEIVAPDHRGGAARGAVLLRTALSLPESAWVDALAHRDTFTPHVTYPVNMAQLEGYELPAPIMQDIKRIRARGDALECALGWLLHAQRIAMGGHTTVIEQDPHYALNFIPPERRKPAPPDIHTIRIGKFGG